MVSTPARTLPRLRDHGMQVWWKKEQNVDVAGTPHTYFHVKARRQQQLYVKKITETF